jgi:hypothetical protein
MNKGHKTKIIQLRKTYPHLRNHEIAKIVGCGTSYVSHICTDTGLGTSKSHTDWEPSYRRIRKEQPELNYRQIAEVLGAHHSVIFRIEKRLEPNRESVRALGVAAARAGLTVQQIQELANARHA